MGFGNVATHIILFIAVITAAGALVGTISMYTQTSTSALKIQQDRLVQELKTDITITSVSYSNTSNPHNTTVYVKNTGKIKLELNQTDIFIDGRRFELSERNLSIETDTEVANTLIWDPKETLKIQAYKNLTSGIHTVRVVADNGIKDEDTFSN